MADEHEAHKPADDKALAALVALSASLNSDVAHKLLDLVRETSTMSVKTSLEADAKVASLLGGLIGAQAARIKRLEKIAVALIAREREGRRKDFAKIQGACPGAAVSEDRAQTGEANDNRIDENFPRRDRNQPGRGARHRPSCQRLDRGCSESDRARQRRAGREAGARVGRITTGVSGQVTT